MRRRRFVRCRYDPLSLLGCLLAIAVPEMAVGQICSIAANPPSPVSVSAPSVVFTANCTPGASSYSWSTSLGSCFGVGPEVDCDFPPGYAVVSVRANYSGGLTATDTYYMQVIGSEPPIGNPNQAITFGTAPNVAVGVTDVVRATASSGLPVTLRSTTPLDCTITGNFVTGVAIGTCTITANQAGNAIIHPAPQTVQSFSVQPLGSKLLSVAQLGDGGGMLAGSPPGILCGSDCSQIYAPGTNVTLNAAPFPRSRFDGWTGPCVGIGDCSFAMDAETSVTARFTYIGTEASKDYAQKAYVAYYGRPADPAGQAYWSGRMDTEGGSVAAIVGSFGSSDEFLRRYGNWSNSQLVMRVYQQALGRDPEPGGLAFYVQSLDTGQRTLQSITLDVLNGAMTPPDSTVVANKLEVAGYYSAKVAAGCTYGTEDYGVYLLSNVTADSRSVTDAKTQIDMRCTSRPPA